MAKSARVIVSKNRHGGREQCLLPKLLDGVSNGYHIFIDLEIISK
jgi:hypothetical protein